MTFHDLIGKLLTVDGIVDGAPDGNIGSDIVPDRIAIGVFLPAGTMGNTMPRFSTLSRTQSFKFFC